MITDGRGRSKRGNAMYRGKKSAAVKAAAEDVMRAPDVTPETDDEIEAMFSCVAQAKTLLRSGGLAMYRASAVSYNVVYVKNTAMTGGVLDMRGAATGSHVKRKIPMEELSALHRQR